MGSEFKFKTSFEPKMTNKVPFFAPLFKIHVGEGEEPKENQ